MPLTPCSFPWARNQTQVALASSFPLTPGQRRWERCQLLVLALPIADVSLEECSSTLSQGWKMYLHCLVFLFAASVFTEIHLLSFMFQFYLNSVFPNLVCVHSDSLPIFLPGSWCPLALICTTFLSKSSVSSCLLIKGRAKHSSQKAEFCSLEGNRSPGTRLFYLFCQLF